MPCSRNWHPTSTGSITAGRTDPRSTHAVDRATSPASPTNQGMDGSPPPATEWASTVSAHTSTAARAVRPALTRRGRGTGTPSSCAPTVPRVHNALVAADGRTAAW
jgi:hypothetical protein